MSASLCFLSLFLSYTILCYGDLCFHPLLHLPFCLILLSLSYCLIGCSLDGWEHCLDLYLELDLDLACYGLGTYWMGMELGWIFGRIGSVYYFVYTILQHTS
ncbi:hypothetical protein M752DRAFT_110370 [Aspergillus phoenicis ATCC 13157]|uniref:Uncharacterized protein n=1 Tax=Aspergillus phoenicis ATCC 13157 TaxID=1353007 RepID=A0A370P4N8_ASPPH|nr:hypothetical protein M752DRAFT_110370 [Aspergillus phoenicis ATCC 13157]